MAPKPQPQPGGLPQTFTVHGKVSDNPQESSPETFDLLLTLALPTVEHYRSDLFHDAAWLAKHTPATVELAPFEFYYVVRPFGTHIGTDGDELTRSASHNGDECWRILVTVDRGRTRLTATRVVDAAAYVDARAWDATS
jgi:hypothetical protein